MLVLTGSGISAESGLPTFRGVGGMWRTHRVEELASPEGFARDPVLVWTWYNERNAVHRRALPNAGHYALAQLETRYSDFTLATQNVDSLHLRAGSHRLLELHGNLRTARCTGCDFSEPLDASGLPLERIEHDCGGRPHNAPISFSFGEALPKAAWDEAVRAAGARLDRDSRGWYECRRLSGSRACHPLLALGLCGRGQSGGDGDLGTGRCGDSSPGGAGASRHSSAALRKSPTPRGR